MKNIRYSWAVAAFIAFASAGANAGLIGGDVWSGWQVFGDDDGVGPRGYVGPGWGGQQFDAEYLLYKVEGTQLSIGLQTGFDILSGHQVRAYDSYWAGDLALSFDGNTTFEYAVDFGLGQCGWSQHANANCGNSNGQGLNAAAGLYKVAGWSNDVIFSASNPFAMASSTEFYSLLANEAGVSGDSYFRKVTFDLASLGIDMSSIGLDAHWTMSCGNDAVDGHAKVAVPEPSSIALLALGIAGVVMLRHRQGS